MISPILAYAAAAVPETLDGAGVLTHDKDYESIAEMMHTMVTDSKLRASILEGQKERISRFRNRDPEAELREHMAPLLSSAPISG